MKPNDTHDREALSALFDGELDGEARLFAMRRLSHDAGWQEDCGRWQMIGDAMRRQAPIAAPSDLVARVLREVAAPVVPDVAPAARTVATPRRAWRAWAGGALVASLALAAVMTVRSPQGVPAGGVAATPAVAAATAAASVGAPAPAPVAPPPTVEAIAAAPTDADADIRIAARPSAAVASRAARRVTPASRADAPAVASAAPALTPDANPFHVPAADALSARPWPRASLAGGSGAFTASYGAGAEARDAAPSFYPFEPKLHADAEANDSP